MRDQSVMCFITFVTNHEVENASNWFQSIKYCFFGINSTFVYVLTCRIAPLETEIAPQIS